MSQSKIESQIDLAERPIPKSCSIEVFIFVPRISPESFCLGIMTKMLRRRWVLKYDKWLRNAALKSRVQLQQNYR